MYEEGPSGATDITAVENLLSDSNDVLDCSEEFSDLADILMNDHGYSNPVNSKEAVC